MAINGFVNDNVVKYWTGRVMIQDNVSIEGKEKEYIDQMLEKLSKNIEITQKKLIQDDAMTKWRSCLVVSSRYLIKKDKPLDEVIYRVRQNCNNKMIAFVNAMAVLHNNESSVVYKTTMYKLLNEKIPTDVRDIYYKYRDSQ